MVPVFIANIFYSYLWLLLRPVLERVHDLVVHLLLVHLLLVHVPVVLVVVITANGYQNYVLMDHWLNHFLIKLDN
jgi:hypothetical protein